MMMCVCVCVGPTFSFFSFFLASPASRTRSLAASAARVARRSGADTGARAHRAMYVHVRTTLLLPSLPSSSLPPGLLRASLQSVPMMWFWPTRHSLRSVTGRRKEVVRWGDDDG